MDFDQTAASTGAFVIPDINADPPIYSNPLLHGEELKLTHDQVCSIMMNESQMSGLIPDSMITPMGTKAMAYETAD